MCAGYTFFTCIIYTLIFFIFFLRACNELLIPVVLTILLIYLITLTILMRRKLDCTLTRICALFVLLFFVSYAGFAQKTVTGTITNGKDNAPIGFATITVKGTTVATVSN